MINSWDDVLKWVWRTDEGETFVPYVKEGFLHYYFVTNTSRHTKWLTLSNNRWDHFEQYRRGGPNPMYQSFIGPMPLAVSPVILKIRQMSARQHARI